ncbi:MAG TPA: hypothetical protein VGI97_14875 [Gemmatimonadaceae bacterium]|jgi:hypothetical protein
MSNPMTEQIAQDPTPRTVTLSDGSVWEYDPVQDVAPWNCVGIKTIEAGTSGYSLHQRWNESARARTPFVRTVALNMTAADHRAIADVLDAPAKRLMQESAPPVSADKLLGILAHDGYVLCNAELGKRPAAMGFAEETSVMQNALAALHPAVVQESAPEPPTREMLDALATLPWWYGGVTSSEYVREVGYDAAEAILKAGYRLHPPAAALPPVEQEPTTPVHEHEWIAGPAPTTAGQRQAFVCAVPTCRALKSEVAR